MPEFAGSPRQLVRTRQVRRYSRYEPSRWRFIRFWRIFREARHMGFGVISAWRAARKTY